MRDFEEIVGKWAQIYDQCGDFPNEIKIMFDGYSEADEEAGIEEALRSRSYAVFVHKLSATEDFIFPEHDYLARWVIHRPDEEVCFDVWLDANGEVEIVSDLDNPKDEAWARDVVMAVQRRYEDEND